MVILALSFSEEFDSFFTGCLILPIALFCLTVIFFRAIKKRRQEKKSVIIVWNVLLVSFFVSLIFLFGEIYYRFYVDTTDSFAINKISKRWIKRYSALNGSGVRDNVSIYNEIAKGRRRITVIGDSFTDGHGVKDVNDRYANILRRYYPQEELHIIAYPGGNSFSELENMKNLKESGYELDIVILAYCLNDIDYYLPETQAIYKRIHSFQNNLGFLASNSYFINTLAFRMFAFLDPDFMNYSKFVLKAYNSDSWLKQKETLREIKNFVRDQGGSFLVVTFPFLQEEKEEYSFREVHSKINDFWKEEGVNHIDLLEVYEPYLGDRLTVNSYDAHPNEFAHQLAAEAINRFFQKQSE